ncbi:unnamed protein product [Moneuplotes crassus]|uniref:GlcNAc-PI synthesis protein n=1 Tax=Euplotes crassus TaxID=5936 RepID=A0AAD1UHC1_EUPCR|nr:unnamed protein product [Moneuplotes crassus]
MEEYKFEQRNNHYKIAFVSDFFYPKLGGVEMHQYQLAQCLQKLGHKVIIITNCKQGRQGVRYLGDGLKVYNCPIVEFFHGVSLPAMFLRLPLFRNIFIREKIDIVHGHQLSSMLMYDVFEVAKALGKKCIFTDHSLFNFIAPENHITNKLLKSFVCHLDAAICVSHVGKENFSLRTRNDPKKVYVINNAVNTRNFRPKEKNEVLDFPPNFEEKEGVLNIIMIGRLVKRKGIELSLKIIPRICQKYPNINFIIGGSGYGVQDLEDMRDKYLLNGRITFLGDVPNHKVRDVLCRGKIFLNTSLTEAFCITILEAASCGLFVVSTNVGGIPEVLPPDMVYLTDPNVDKLCEKLDLAIQNIDSIDEEANHKVIKSLYSWKPVAKKTEKVYEEVMNTPSLCLGDMFKLTFSGGWLQGLLCCMKFCLLIFIAWVAEYIQPEADIDPAVDFPVKEYISNKEKYGDHEFIFDTREDSLMMKKYPHKKD